MFPQDPKNQIVQYLLERGLLNLKSVVDGQVVVTALTSRHRNVAVLRRDGPG